MSGLDAILARSRDPGVFVERREFTLSREKALEKLREFSLRHPSQYVLELIQAAVFAGASYIAVDISEDRLLVAWVGGRPCQAPELEQLFDYLFADRAAPETRHLVQLAIGLNAALQRRPRLIRIESGDGDPQGAVRLDLDKRGEGSLGRSADALAGTYVAVEYARSWFARFSGQEFQPEEALIESRCPYLPVPLLLNGRAPFGYRAQRRVDDFGSQRQLRFDEGGRRGVLALEDKPAAFEQERALRPERGFHMVVGGVWITTLKLPQLGSLPDGEGGARPLRGVLCDDRLRKSADQSDIVQDERFLELLHAVQPLATRLIRTCPTGSKYRPPALPPLRASPASAPDADEGAAPELLPPRISQLAPRRQCDLAALRALPAELPVFWVDHDEQQELSVAGDPGRFPYPVLVLTPGQVETLARKAPQLALGRLRTPADVDFVRGALERRRPMRQVTRPVAGGSLNLHLHLAGGVPDPLQGGESCPSLALVADGRSAWYGHLDLRLPGVSAALQLDEEPEDPQQLGRRCSGRSCWRPGACCSWKPPRIRRRTALPSATCWRRCWPTTCCRSLPKRGRPSDSRPPWRD